MDELKQFGEKHGEPTESEKAKLAASAAEKTYQEYPKLKERTSKVINYLKGSERYSAYLVNKFLKEATKIEKKR